MASSAPLRIGTRGSPLALAQARLARAALAAAHPALAEEAAVEIVAIKTSGDRIQDRKLIEVGGKGLFTKEIEEALLAGSIDLAVHSMKDLPSWLPQGLTVAAVLPREDPRDAFIAGNADSLAALPAGARVGTASLRRQAQVLLARPDLRVVPLRGNVETRLAKLARGEADATLLALAGLRRLGLADRPHRPLSTDEMLPAVAQGAIALEARSDDAETGALLAAIDHRPSRLRVTAERTCLAVLDGSCHTPIAALAELEGEALWLRGLVVLPDGSQAHRTEARAPAADAARLGEAVGAELRAKAGERFFAALAASA